MARAWHRPPSRSICPDIWREGRRTVWGRVLRASSSSVRSHLLDGIPLFAVMLADQGKHRRRIHTNLG